ncbi:IucA/IucC family protein [Nitrospina sp. 32_T5]|uniref:IucA/IucC family protein n=1 Tax=unclassified Nitrospina TaxID=2638683 RepID=UPI003F9B3FF0
MIRLSFLMKPDSVLHGLVDALLQENLFGVMDRMELSGSSTAAGRVPGFQLDEDESYISLPLPGAEGRIVFRARRHAFLQPFRLSRPPVLHLSPGDGETVWQEQTPEKLVLALAATETPGEVESSWPNLPAFLEDLDLSIEQSSLSIAKAGAVESALASSVSPGLVAWERFAALEDRPFHPTARAKSGWTAEDYRHYSAEYGNDFLLAWVAVQRGFIESSPAATGSDPWDSILTGAEREKLKEMLCHAGLAFDEYCVMPVHPWHAQHVLPEVLASEFERGVCVPLAGNAGRFTATSSVRSLAPANKGANHIKLPIGIRSLGALRILPPRYLHNGVQGQKLLEQVIARSALADGRLYLCSEEKWWSLSTPEDGPLADRPGHLSCMVRAYPQQLIENPRVSLVPMSALTVVTGEGRTPAMEKLLSQWPVSNNGDEWVLEVFGVICRQLIEFSFVCFGFGVMPEVHGQNVLLVIRDGGLDGLLLRDHDTVRIHRPWLQARGLPEPDYVLNHTTPNTMINHSPEDLLMYFQTLGVQVNLFAIVHALAQAYPVTERDGWHVIKNSIESALAALDLPAPARDVLERELLQNDTWPTKLLLTPFLAREATGAGMPSGRGLIANPLRALTVEPAQGRADS